MLTKERITYCIYSSWWSSL